MGNDLYIAEEDGIYEIPNLLFKDRAVGIAGRRSFFIEWNLALRDRFIVS